MTHSRLSRGSADLLQLCSMWFQFEASNVACINTSCYEQDECILANVCVCTCGKSPHANLVLRVYVPVCVHVYKKYVCPAEETTNKRLEQ